MQPPAMDAAAVAMDPAATVRIHCPLERHCLYAGHTVPEGDDPAEAVRHAAGCRDDPPACPCAHGLTRQDATVAAVATIPAPGMTPLRTASARPGARTVAQTAGAPQPRALPAAASLDAPQVPDSPLVAARPVVGLAGMVGPDAVTLTATTRPDGDSNQG